MVQEDTSMKQASRKLPYAQVFFVFLAFGLMVLLSYWFTSNIERDHLRDDTEKSFINIETQLVSDLNELETMLSVVSETVRYKLVNGQSNEEVKSYLYNITRYGRENTKLRGFDSVFVMFADGSGYNGLGVAMPQDYEPQNRPWYLVAEELGGRGIGVTEPYVDAASGSVTLTFVRNIYDGDHRIAIVALDILLDNISEYTFENYNDDTGYWVVFDKDLTVIAHPHKMFLGMPLKEIDSGIAELTDELLAEGIITERSVINYTGDMQIISIQPLENGWYLGVVTLIDSYYKNLYQMQGFLIAFGLVLAIGLSLILVHMINRKNKMEDQAKLMQSKMREAEELTQIMFDAAPLAMNLWNRDMKNLRTNNQAVLMFDLADKQEYLDKFFELSPEYQPNGRRSEEMAREYINRAFEEGDIRFEWLHSKGNGELVPCEITLVRVKYKDDYAVVGYSHDMRELKAAVAQAEKSASEKETLSTLQNIFSGLEAMVFVSDPKTDEVLFMNDNMKLHYDIKEDVVGRHCYELIKENITERCSDCPCYQLDKEPEKVFIWEQSNSRTGRIYRNANRYINWPDGRIAHLQHSVDITDMKYELMKYELMRDAQHVAVWDVDVVLKDPMDPNNKIVFGLDFRKMLGFSEEDDFPNLLSSWTNRLHPEDKDEVLDAFVAHINDKTGETPFDMEYRLQMKDGKYRYFRAFGMALRDDDGIPIRVAGALEDIHDKKQLEKEINQVNQFNQSILDSMPICYTVFDRNLTFLDCNDEYAKLLKTPKELFLNNFFEFAPKIQPDGQSSEEKVAGLLERAIAGEISIFEWTHKALDGELVPCEVTVTRIRSDDEFVGMSFTYDLRNIKRMEESLREQGELLKLALEQANAANRAKSDFLSQMSHEMRTPMNAIIGMTAIGKNAKDEEQKDYALGRIESASSHLLGVINDVLDMAKIEANRLELSPIEYHFERMLQRVVSVITFRVEEKRQKLIVNVDREIPRFVVGDDQRLAQVITNLLSNATKFTPEEGEISLDVSLLGESDGICELRIEVADTGIGVSKEHKDRLFHAFVQAESGTSREYGGTGLGLVISKNIVELMDGKIWVETEEGKGSHFIFTAKLKRGEKNSRLLLDSGVNWENVKVLVVDDMPEIREQFYDLFHHLEISCDVAESGEEACRLIEERGGYDVYFVDWRMPGMDGIELTRRIKEMGADKPSVVIMITAMDWESIREDAYKAGVGSYLLKPLFSSMIIDCMNECLGVPLDSGEVDPDMLGIFKNKKMLLAEDVEINREILIALLEDTGITIDCAENGIEALDMIKEAPDKYDIVFMDVQMPKMDGLEATRQIRALPPGRRGKLPIVAMTANVFKSDIEECLGAGMDDHLGKPFDMDKVMEKLRKYLA